MCVVSAPFLTVMSCRTLTLFEIRNDNLQVTVGGQFKKRQTLNEEFDKWYETMSGRKEYIRKGDKGEYLSQLFLSAIAFSNPTYRQEDWGVDFVCSLINRIGDNLYPTDTFTIQVKTSKDCKFELENKIHNMDWFYDRQEPFFLCHLETEKQEMYFYNTSHLHQVSIQQLTNYNKIISTYSLDVNEDETEITYSPTHFKNNIKFILGSPFLTLKMSDLLKENSDILEDKKRLLKTAIFYEKQNIAMRNFKFPFFIWLRKYKTNSELTYSWKHYGDLLETEINNPDETIPQSIHLLAGLCLSFKNNGDIENFNRLKDLLISKENLNNEISDVINILGIKDGQPKNIVYTGDTKNIITIDNTITTINRRTRRENDKLNKKRKK
ncbi:MAG: hypothetical protein JW870_17105 [Candidatus Delongbacteria bacterium]|nr:hypothetical protein [Candidatus Delongbacteria bacterium]